MKEIFTLLVKELRDRKLFNEIPAGTVLTGGGAETVAMTEIAKRSLNLPARVGHPVSLKGITHDLKSPEFATVIGTLMYAQEQGGLEPRGAGIKLPSFKLKLNLNLKQIPAKIQQLVKSILP
jgi:cell division protein FtsA